MAGGALGGVRPFQNSDVPKAQICLLLVYWREGSTCYLWLWLGPPLIAARCYVLRFCG